IDKPALRSLAEDLDLSSVHFLDQVAPERTPALMAAADMQLVSLADRDLFRITLARVIRRASSMPREELSAMGRAGFHYYGTTQCEAINACALADLLRGAAA